MMKINISNLSIFFLLLIISACVKKESPIQPTACISALPDEIRINDTIDFSSACSENAEFYQWNFGDSTSSYESNAKHVYLFPGTKTVQLIAFNKELNDTSSVSITVLDKIPDPVADFSFNPSTPFINDEVQFANNSTNADQYTWDFGDGNASELENPAHTYNEIGEYTITLIARSTIGTSEIQKSITVQNIPEDDPIAFFAYYPAEPLISDTITFFNKSENANAYSWDFGDGTSSTEFEPKHYYTSAGNYTIVLTASNKSTTDRYELNIQVFDIDPYDYNSFPVWSELYRNDFTTDNGDYWTGTGDSISSSVIENEEIIHIVNSSSSGYTFPSGIATMPDEYSNYDIEMRFTLDYDGNYNFGGLFWGNEPNADLYYYLWTKSSELGYYNISNTTVGENEEPWGFGEGGNTSDFNKITVRKYNDQYYFFLNEVFIIEHAYEPDFGSAFGIYVGAGIELKVDYILTRNILLSKTDNNKNATYHKKSNNKPQIQNIKVKN